MRGSTDWTISQNTIYGVGDASYAGIYELDGYGVISDNTLIDADGGILVDGVTSPPPQSVNLCSIGRYSYSTFSSCSFALPAGSDVTVDIQDVTIGAHTKEVQRSCSQTELRPLSTVFLRIPITPWQPFWHLTGQMVVRLPSKSTTPTETVVKD